MDSRGKRQWCIPPGSDKRSMRSVPLMPGCFLEPDLCGMLNAGRFVEFLKEFRKGRLGSICLVVDDHPSHRARIVKDYVQGTQGKPELHFLPPCAPNPNPDEFVWKHAKTNGAAKQPLRQDASLKKRVPADLSAIKADKQPVQ